MQIASCCGLCVDEGDERNATREFLIDLNHIKIWYISQMADATKMGRFRMEMN